uniref:L-tyrosine decarboxylase C-terminal domain-containing protein n=1 Tax=Psilocybe cubensis TaxID=181762 RepID=A0A8H7XPX8_PSICU
MFPSNTSISYNPSSSGLHETVSAWFLGPQAENAALLKELFNNIVDSHANARLSYHPEDGVFITQDIKQTPAFNRAVNDLRQEFHRLLDMLNDKSIPFYSPRYAGHMSFESSLPSILGWLAAMLFNPNNVAFEASPITTLLELDAGSQICDMLGYARSGTMQPWGHITCDGTVANIESMCCSNPNDPVLLRDLDTWELLNLQPQEILSIPDRLRTQFGVSPTFLERALHPFSVQSIGKDSFEKKYGIEPPQYLISSTKHYSWPKAAALVGIGSDNVINIPVDSTARMCMIHLKYALERRLRQRQAVYAVVAIIGSTEEGAVDPLDEIVALKHEYQARGMSFLIHADAAWGGYFASMLREKPSQGAPDGMPPCPRRSASRDYVPTTSLKEHTIRQFEVLGEADSVTIDPHKSGYCPYPSGGLCYKDGRMRYLLTWTAPYLNQGKNGENIGIYGVEGSKPGAAAAAVYLHHAVVGLHKEGHGSLLGEVCFSCARISAYWAAMSDSSTPYIVVPLNKLRAEPNALHTEQEKKFIRWKILARSNRDIASDPDPELFAELRALGSDLNINAFACNFRIQDHQYPFNSFVNDDVEEANYLNKCIFDRLSVTNVQDNPRKVPMYITSTTFAAQDYGQCLDVFKQRLGLEIDSKQSLFVLRNVVMSPFQATANFAGEIAELFRQTLIEEMSHVVARNTISPQEHMFIMQGTDTLFLVYRPLFHKANSRKQLIIAAKMSGIHWARYLKAREDHPEEIFTMTIPSTTIEEIVSGQKTKGYIYWQGTVVSDCELEDVSVVKSRSLRSRWRDSEYPSEFCPFYMYGSEEQQHIEHMLLKAPNAQLAAEDIEISLDRPLLKKQLERGLLAYVMVHEQSMQPFAEDNPPFFFCAGAKLDVEIYEDPFTSEAHGPGLAPTFNDLDGPSFYSPVASGSIQLGSRIFIDMTGLNKQDFKADNRISRYTEVSTSEEGKAGWRSMVIDRMDQSEQARRQARVAEGWATKMKPRVSTPSTNMRSSPLAKN